jgi:hypothetical protein
VPPSSIAVGEMHVERANLLAAVLFSGNEVTLIRAIASREVVPDGGLSLRAAGVVLGSAAHERRHIVTLRSVLYKTARVLGEPLHKHLLPSLRRHADC